MMCFNHRCSQNPTTDDEVRHLTAELLGRKCNAYLPSVVGAHISKKGVGWKQTTTISTVEQVNRPCNRGNQSSTIGVPTTRLNDASNATRTDRLNPQDTAASQAERNKIPVALSRYCICSK